MQSGMRTREEIEQRLKAIRVEEKSLLAELLALDAKRDETLFPSPLGERVRLETPKSVEEKLKLFKELFACQENVYPKLWHNQKSGAKGYSPACNNEWIRGVCDKPRVKCSECPNQAFPSLDEFALRRHLEGQDTVGTYAIERMILAFSSRLISTASITRKRRSTLNGQPRSWELQPRSNALAPARGPISGFSFRSRFRRPLHASLERRFFRAPRRFAIRSI